VSADRPRAPEQAVTGPVEWATPRDLAADAAERIRDLIHETQQSSGPDTQTGYQAPADVDAALAELERLAEMLAQALDQARVWLLRARAAGRVGDDRPDYDGRLTVESATARLEVAGARATALAEHLAAAREHTSHLTRITPEGAGRG
jgi:hypothetical protein